MLFDFPISAIALCYAPLAIMILGFIGFAIMTDADARRTYLRDMDPRIDDDLTTADVLAKRKTDRTLEAETPSGSRVMVKPESAEKKAESSVAGGSVTGANTAAANAPAPTPVAVAEVAEPTAGAAVAKTETVITDEPAEDEAPPADPPTLEEAVKETPDVDPLTAETETQAEVIAEEDATPPVKPNNTPDDLQKIEGIGPTVSRALIAQGIDTFAVLSQKSVDELRDALADEGVRFAPSAESWAEQAEYAARDDWDGLAALQDRLISGRYPPEEK